MNRSERTASVAEDTDEPGARPDAGSASGEPDIAAGVTAADAVESQAAARRPSRVRRVLSRTAGRLRRRRPVWSPRGRRIGVAVLAALIVGGVAAAAALASYTASAAAGERVSAEALDAARHRLPVVLSYRAETLDADLAKAREQITGPFAADFDDIAATVIVPSARERQITTTATVVRAAVAGTRAEGVEVLAFVNQTTTSAGQAPQEAASTVRVALTEVDGQWLISGVTPA